MNKVTIAKYERDHGKAYILVHPCHGPDKFFEGLRLAELEQSCVGWELLTVQQYIDREEDKHD